MADLPKTRGTILIVDDEPDVLWFISKMYQPLGYETLTAGSGMEALKLVEECGPKIDLVILDLKMPGMGGVEVLRSIRKHCPGLPVIILTALLEKEKECRALGIETFIRKPYSLKDLNARIEAVIDRKNDEKEPLEIEPGYEPCARILIVDDEEEVCEILGPSLAEDVADAHFEVKWVRSGDEALCVSREFEPDIAIIDIKMPFMWGDELIRRFKAGEGHCPKDFVIYTSVVDPEQVEWARKMGHKIFSKPTHLEVLVDNLKKICVRHKLLRKRS
ncbi:MAG: response regulator [Candidatus Omnitrophica bacterium]|nr:response regulator [Candidatus Omnitrophota bacterium]